MIDLGDATPHALHESDPALLRKSEVCTRSGKVFRGRANKSYSLQRDMVVYQANLGELTRHLKREATAFERLFARAKSIEQTGI